MSNASATPSYKGRAIILISGASQLSVVDEVLDVLKPYSLRVEDHQQILMAGRLIAAFEISFDPAHADAIEDDLSAQLKSKGFDIALEIL